MPIFGDNKDYDRKCLKLYNLDGNKDNTIKKLEKLIKDDKILLAQNKDIMDSCCIDGYKWSDEMTNTINYHNDMLNWIKKNNSLIMQ